MLQHLLCPWRRLVSFCLPAIIISGMFLGCDRARESSDGRVRVAAVLMQEDQFFRINEAGMRAAAADLDVDLRLGNAYGKVEQEVRLVETHMARGIDAILVSPLSLQGSLPVLRRAHAADIRLVIYNTDLDAEFPDSFITSDQTNLGATTGDAARKYIEEKLDGKAKVAIIQFVSQSLELGPLRPNGFKSRIADMPGVTIVAEQDAWIAHRATEVVETLLGAHPDLNIIWAANEGGTVGAVTAVRNAGRAGNVVVFGTDMSDQLAGFLLAEDNILQAVTAQRPFDMGYQAMSNAVKLARNEPVEKRIVLQGQLFSREDPKAVQTIREQMRAWTK